MLDERTTAALTCSTALMRCFCAPRTLDGARLRTPDRGPVLLQVRVEHAAHALLGPIDVSGLERRGQGEAEVRLARLFGLDVLAHDGVWR